MYCHISTTDLDRHIVDACTTQILFQFQFQIVNSLFLCRRAQRQVGDKDMNLHVGMHTRVYTVKPRGPV